jgi:hypothetical protein
MTSVKWLVDNFKILSDLGIETESPRNIHDRFWAFKASLGNVTPENKKILITSGTDQACTTGKECRVRKEWESYYENLKKYEESVEKWKEDSKTSAVKKPKYKESKLILFTSEYLVGPQSNLELQVALKPGFSDPVTCCKSCFFHTKIFSLIHVLKAAHVKLDELKDFSAFFAGAYAFGVKTKAKSNSKTLQLFQNLLVLNDAKNKLQYLIVKKGYKIELIKIKTLEIDSFHKNYKRNVSFVGPNPVSPKNTELFDRINDKSISLIKIQSIVMSITESLPGIKLDLKLKNQISESFKQAYPELGMFSNIQELLRKKEKINLDLKKDEETLYELFQNLFKTIKMRFQLIFYTPSYLIGILLCIGGTVFLISREYSMKKQKKMKTVPVL